MRWAAFLVVSWLLLRPSLLVTISLDDFINPFYVFDRYGPSPFGMVSDMTRDVTRNGHFNYVGQNLGAIVFVVWTHLLSWGVRYSLIYATTKFVVFIVAALVVARLLRTLSALAGRQLSVWHSRAVVAVVLFSTLQLHVAWSLDPVGSFPLFGYLAAAIGLAALDYAVQAMQRSDRRSVVIAAIALCLAVQYYELNVVMIGALAPLAWLIHRRRVGEPLRVAVARLAFIVGPCIAMSMVLRTIAARSNRGYTGTDVALGDGTIRVLLRALAGSLPGSSWPVARDWLAQPLDVFATTLVTVIVVALALIGWRRFVKIDAGDAQTVVDDPRSSERLPARSRWSTLALLVAAPLAVWVGATLVQVSTAKVRAETLRVGYVYTYYAYGSIAVVLILVLIAGEVIERMRSSNQPRSRRLLSRSRPAVMVLALLFVGVQATINDNVQRVFDERLAANSAVLVAYSERPPESERCELLAEWNALPYWLAYYRRDFISGLDAAYQHFHDEPFCAAIPIPPAP
jgi:hypothetical protein